MQVWEVAPVLASSWMRGWTPSPKGCVRYPCSLHICPLCTCAGHVLCPCSVPWVSTHCRLPRPFNRITQWVSARVILAVATRGQQRFSLLTLESASTAVVSQVGSTRHKSTRQKTSLHLLKIKEDPYCHYLLPTILDLRKCGPEGIKVTQDLVTVPSLLPAD